MLSGALESTNTHQAYEDVKHCLERLENAQSIEDIGDYETELADIYQELQEVACDYADYSTPSGHVMNIKNIEGRYDEVISIMFSKNNRRDDPEDGLSACIIIDEKEGVIKELSFQEGKICRHSLEHARGY